MRSFITIILILSIVKATSLVHAHHSFSSTFKDETITVEGVVERMSFTNPHVTIFFTVTDVNGKQTEWISEGSAATLKRREGWDRDTIVKGDTIRVTGNSTHNGSPMVSMEEISFIDPNTGSILGLPGRDERADYVNDTLAMQLDDGRPNLTGYWASVRRGGARPQAAAVPLNDVGKALQANYDIKDDPQVQCEAPGLIRQTGTPHPIRIEQHEDHVVISYEEYGGVRTIYFDDRDLRGGDNTNFGQSIARYEDQTLVIETGNLSANVTSGRGNIVSDQTTTIETFSRLSDADGASGINFEITINDPGHLSEPWVRGWQKFYTPGHEFIEVDCHKPLAY